MRTLLNLLIIVITKLTTHQIPFNRNVNANGVKQYPGELKIFD